MHKGEKRPILEVRDLNVYYGRSHALQGVDLTLPSGVLSVVGRNGMGKTTLCKTIMGLQKAALGSISFDGRSLIGMTSVEIARAGIGYVPQGRRLWKSLSVDEHLRLVERKGGAWTVDRVYSVFPRLAERRNNGGGALSGGEQQMLAIGRALLLNPRLLVMDEPTEGLAPVIVNQVADMLVRLGQEGDIDVLVIEQNIGVACAVARNVAIMVNGRINRVMDAAILHADKDLQQALLGVGRHAHDEAPDTAPRDEGAAGQAAKAPRVRRIYTSNPVLPTRWSQDASLRQIHETATTLTEVTPLEVAREKLQRQTAAKAGGVVYVCGTLDTKRRELEFLRDRIRAAGIRVQLVDLSTSGSRVGGDIPPNAIALHHPRGPSLVFTDSRETAAEGMAIAFRNWVQARQDIAGLLGAAGAMGSKVLAEGFREAPLGLPKIIVSTIAAGDISGLVGVSDMTVMHSVADVAGINSITRYVLTNAAGAMAGMVLARRKDPALSDQRPSIGLSVNAGTAEAVRQAIHMLEGDYQCVSFNATGPGCQSMEALLEQGRLDGVLDITMADIASHVVGGLLSANEDRLGAIIRLQLPYVGACGGLDAASFAAHGPGLGRQSGLLSQRQSGQATLRRVSVEDSRKIGQFIGSRLNQMRAPVRLFLNEGGLSALDAPGQPLWEPEARAALFESLEKTVAQTAFRQLVRVPHHINDPAFAQLLAKTLASFSAATTPQTVGGRR